MDSCNDFFLLFVNQRSNNKLQANNDRAEMDFTVCQFVRSQNINSFVRNCRPLSKLCMCNEFKPNESMQTDMWCVFYFDIDRIDAMYEK